MVQTAIERDGIAIFRIMATPPMIPPNWSGLKIHNTSQDQTAQLTFLFPKRGPGSSFIRFMAVIPRVMDCRPNSSCSTILTRQLTRITQRVTKPALAPRDVVAISSPEPTTDAERMKPGPRNFSFSLNLKGDSRTAFLSNL